MYTLGEAAKEVNVSKATISRAIKKGKLSANRNDDNTYAIDPAELSRWFDSNGRINGQSKRNQTHDRTLETPSRNEALQTEVEMLRKLAEERARTIDDLRGRLDKESDERRKLTAMLTDQRVPEKPKGFWRRLTGN